MKKALSIFVALGLAVSLAACSAPAGNNSGAADAPEGAIKIGGIGPVTGAAAVYGNAVKNGAELAVKEINAKGGLQFVMNYQDDEHDAEKAVNAYNSLKDWGLQVLMGTVTSTPCIAVAQESKNDNVFQITPSGTAVDCVKYDNAFRMCFSDPNQGVESAKYIADNNLAKKIAIIYDSSDAYSSGIREAFVTKAKELGLEVVSDEAFTADSNKDFSVQLQKAQSAGAELMFLPIYYTEASLILTQANKMGFAPKVFGCDGLDGLLAVENFDKTLAEGVIFLSPFSTSAQDTETKTFVEAYKAAYKEMPNQFAADAYDSVFVIAQACEKAGVTADMTASEMCDLLKVAVTEISFDGLTGKGITWAKDGEPNKAPIVLKVENGEQKVL